MNIFQKEDYMFKKSILIIGLMLIGLVALPAQVALPPLPEVTLTMPPRPAGTAPYKINVTSAQLRKLLENRDQKNYTAYLFNSGYIPQEEYDERAQKLDVEYYNDLVGAIMKVDQIAGIYADGVVKEEIEKLWGHRTPGWFGKEWGTCIGFELKQPQGTRVTAESPESTNYTRIRLILNPYSDQNYNDLKEQLEKGLGAPLVLNQAFAKDPVNSRFEYDYFLRSAKSASGKPYRILFTRNIKQDYIYVEMQEQSSDSF
jgi:hypothetical protein